MNNHFVISTLIDLFSKERVLLDCQSILQYGKDLAETTHCPHALCVVFPIHKNELVSLVHFATQNKLLLVPSGGRTGYSAGATAYQNEIIVSFEKMNRVLDFNAADKLIYCEAGATLKTIQEYATQHNLFYPIDFASSADCQIGGNIVTNAGGIRVIKYGATRQWVMGLTVVTGRGDILECNKGLTKNATGYDLRHLFVGSEGTLGFIAEAILKLIVPPINTRVVFFSFSEKKHLMTILSELQAATALLAFEFFCSTAMQCVMQAENLAFPFQKNREFYGIFEYESEDHRIVEATANKLIQEKMINEILVSQDEKASQHFWRYRKGISRSLKKYFPYKYDLAVLPSKIVALIDAVVSFFENDYADIQTVWFGHAGDGNLHLNILKPDTLSTSTFFTLCEKISNAVYALIQQFHGSICAEHGVGLLKKPYLHYSKSESEIQYMREIKNIFDPHGVMNPGKLI